MWGDRSVQKKCQVIMSDIQNPTLIKGLHSKYEFMCFFLNLYRKLWYTSYIFTAIYKNVTQIYQTNQKYLTVI
jgi:hypothetical protein